MFEVSKKSWHFKLLNYYVIYPKTLCTYFWTVVFFSLVYPFDWCYHRLKRIHCKLKYNLSKFYWNYPLAIISISAFAYSIYFNKEWVFPHPFALLFMIGFLELLIFGMIIAGMMLLKFLDRKKKEKKPNLFLALLKAKKEKICPLIEYKK